MYASQNTNIMQLSYPAMQLSNQLTINQEEYYSDCDSCMCVYTYIYMHIEPFWNNDLVHRF